MDEINNDMNHEFDNPEENVPEEQQPVQADQDESVQEPAAEQMQETAYEEHSRPSNPRRRRRSKKQIFKEAYLPAVIAGVALLFVLIFIIGSISRNVQKHKVLKAESIEASESVAQQEAELRAVVDDILKRAADKAAAYDYNGAIEILDSYTGDLTAAPEIRSMRDKYSEAISTMSPWGDPSQVLNLSFHMLVADPARAYADEDYADAYRRNFVTITEFSNILTQLYENNYMLVSLDDFITEEKDADGNVTFGTKTVYLPKDKKPVMITQTNVTYYRYMIDGDGDGEPDKDGAGFASRLMLDDKGEVTCELIGANGEILTGAYDLVPLLNDFIKVHPDFAYNNARAVIAVSGYEGVLGYRTDSATKTEKGEDYYNQQAAQAKAVADAMKKDGYVFACYSYENKDYASISAAEVESDIQKWIAEVTPILGSTDILAYAQNADIALASADYTGEVYNGLKNAGFHYYLGFANKNPWATVNSDYVRQGRTMVTGENLINFPSMFGDAFDSEAVLDPARSAKKAE